MNQDWLSFIGLLMFGAIVAGSFYRFGRTDERDKSKTGEAK